MARPVSWLPRLHEIQQSVAGSVRSHYLRSELETLFQVQPRSAGRLLEMLPSTMVGTARAVAKDDLLKFLAGVETTETPEELGAFFDRAKEANAQDSRKKLRILIRRDVDTMTLANKPAGLFFTRGRVEMDFETVEELAQLGLALALILESDAEEVARRYERREEPEGEDESVAEVAALFRELEALERNRAPVEAPCVENGPV